jgi:phosphate transport system ATP-binding protein
VGTLLSIQNLSVWYGDKQALFSLSFDIPKNSITAFIGPSGCGKTTMLRSINRLGDLIRGYRLEGRILLDGRDIYEGSSPKTVKALRKGIGMVFQSPNPLPTTIMKNLAFPLKEHYQLSKAEINSRAVDKLKLCGLYDEVEDRLHKSALKLSGGQQQRLCIARALMLEPDIILFDEPCSALDPISTFRIEEVLQALKQRYTIVMVTHNLEQARRIADQTVFFYLGRIIESGLTEKLFFDPETEMLGNYISGRR